MASGFRRSGRSPTLATPQDPVDVLEQAKALPGVTRKNLTQVARRLARSGCLLAIRYDTQSARFAFYSVPQGLTRSQAALLPVFKPLHRLRAAKGSVRLPSGDQWFGSIEAGGPADHPALLTVERKSRRRKLEPADAALVIPPGEADALLALINGLVTQARRQGILAPSPQLLR
jgi:hypothetical protein